MISGSFCQNLQSHVTHRSRVADDVTAKPLWDPLRDDPRFERLVEEAKKPVALK
jgi:hypothetical protein